MLSSGHHLSILLVVFYSLMISDYYVLNLPVGNSTCQTAYLVALQLELELVCNHGKCVFFMVY